MDRGLYNNRINQINIAFLFATVVACCMVVFQTFRMETVHGGSNLFYIWNLLLSWIPYFISLWLFRRILLLKKRDFLNIASGAVWLLFFPNSLYILTDFLHLDRLSYIFVAGADGGKTIGDFAPWFEFSLVALFIGIGLIMGMLSLYFIHYIMNTLYGYLVGWLSAIAIIIVSTYGIYIGRVLRSNSWHVISEPLELVKSIWGTLNMETLLFMLALSTMYVCLYIIYYNMTSMFKTWH